MTNTKKALLVTTVSGFVPQFEMNNVRILQNMGYEVHYATNYNTPSYGKDNHRLDGTGIVRHQIDFVRSPFKPENFTIYKQLCCLMQEEHFDLVHCHTPMGGVMARLAAHATHTGPVIYTAHGFHFYRGASFVNWLCYYPMERFLSHFTDQQICINREDYNRAKTSFHAKYIDYIPGVGIDLNRIPEFDKDTIDSKKKELGFPTDKWILMSSGELIKRKNHETIIRSMAKLKNTQPHPPAVHYAICGHGQLDTYLVRLTEELDVTDMVTFLGYREDILEVYQTADIFIFPSYQEGLPVALLEAMASGLPVICSDIRGNQDLMGPVEKEHEHLEYCPGGIMVRHADSPDEYCRAILQILASPEKLPAMRTANKVKSRDFSIGSVSEIMEQIYERLQGK